MAGVVLEGVSRIYPGPVTALDNVSLTVEDGQFLVLVGPSGSGKTTLLRLIAGLEEVTQGDIRIDHRSMRGVPTWKRDVAMVFQNYVLYPHLTVRRNLAVGLEYRWRAGRVRQRLWSLVSPRKGQELRARRDEIDRRVAEAARLLELEPLLQRRPDQLSGGQRQRVALGRALVRQAAVYLLDEPLASLDAPLRADLQYELKQLHRRLRTTMICVTHDQAEALALGDRIAVLHEGRMQQLGTPEELYGRPRNRFVAEFLGTPRMNFLEGRLEDRGEQTWFVSRDCSVALDKTTALRVQPYIGRMVVLGLRPEDVRILPAGQSEGIPGRIADVELLAGSTVVRVQCTESAAAHVGAAAALVCRTQARARMAAGDLVSMHLDMRQAHFFDPQSGENVSWPPMVEGN